MRSLLAASDVLEFCDNEEPALASRPEEDARTSEREDTDWPARVSSLAPSPSEEDRCATKFATWSLSINSSKLEAVAKPILPTVSVNVLLIWLWTALEPFSVTICAIALTFWFS